MIPIIDDCLVLAAGKHHPFYERNLIFSDELNGQPFAMREKGSGTRQLFENYADKHKLLLKVTWEANCPRTILNAVLYIKCCPSCLCDSCLMRSDTNDFESSTTKIWNGTAPLSWSTIKTNFSHRPSTSWRKFCGNISRSNFR